MITGEIAPGEKLVTDELANRWGVSPTPLRETQRLAAEGLIDLTPQRGVRVAEMSENHFLDVDATRLFLEPHALRLSLQRRDADWEDHVRAAYAPLRAELERGLTDLVAFEDAHSAFHQALIERCGSPWLLRLISLLQGHSTRYRLQSVDPLGGIDEVIHEHDDLLSACLDGDVELAADRLRAHLQLTIDSLESVSTKLPTPSGRKT